MPSTVHNLASEKTKQVKAVLESLEGEEEDKPLVKGTWEYRWDRLQWLRFAYYKIRGLSFVEDTVYVDIRCVTA